MIVGFIGLSLTAESSLADGKSNYLHICYQHCQQIIIPETLKVYSNQICRRYLYPYLPSIFHTSRIIYSALSVRAKVYTRCDSSRDFLLKLIPMKIIFACTPLVTPDKWDVKSKEELNNEELLNCKPAWRSWYILSDVITRNAELCQITAFYSDFLLFINAHCDRDKLMPCSH